jgi:hypothetical protein
MTLCCMKLLSPAVGGELSAVVVAVVVVDAKLMFERDLAELECVGMNGLDYALMAALYRLR